MIKYYNENAKFDPFIDDVINSLFPRNTAEALIEIEFVEELEDNHAGLCTGDTEYVQITLSKNFSFECGDTSNYCDQEIASNLAHELVHARQFINGEINETDYVWKGVDYRSSDYADTPWEVEAYAMEKVLVDLFWETKDV